MAYAALVSLKTTLRQTILMYSADRYPILGCDRDQVYSFLENLDFLQHQFLESAAYKTNTLVVPLRTRIRDAAYEAQYILDIHLISGDYATWPIEEGEKNGEYVMKLKNADLRTVIREIDAIKQEIHLLNKDQSLTVTLPDDAQPRPWNSLRAKFGSDSKNVMVGFNDLRLQIKEQLSGESSSSLQVISVVGMGGSGKTTLAISTYNDPYIVDHFDIRGWVTVSQSYSDRNIILDLLDSMKLLSRDVRNHSDDDYLACHLHKCLKEKRYFIVIDDIWDTDAWDAVRRMFPNDSNGSRIMLTTRITDVAAYASTSSDSIYHMPLLSDDSSWILLRAKVFGSESDRPLDLEEIGKDIAGRCRGLPLSVAVMAGLLSKVDKTYEAWQAVAENLTTSLLSSSEDLISSNILKMSYDYLPQHLKSCFLYLAIFPEDYAIDVTRLTNLWIAEGFVDSDCSQSLEETADRWLGELVDRSLLSMSKIEPHGRMKTCRIHDLLLDLCVKESLSERIVQVVKWEEDTHLFPDISPGQLRFSVHSMDMFRYIKIPTSRSLVRSIICIGEYHLRHLADAELARFKLLRVLDLLLVVFNEFPEKVTELVQLRYLAFSYTGKVRSSLSKLFYLQTLIINNSFKISELRDGLSLPFEILTMKHLRHIEFDAAYLNVPSIDHAEDENFDIVLEELHTISGIQIVRFAKELIRRIPNIRKLNVQFLFGYGGVGYEFENLANLRQLKELNIILYSSFMKLDNSNFVLPKSLETLSLTGSKIPWEDLSSILGSLPCLKVLKLKDVACVGKEWEPKEGDFCELKVLELDTLELRRWNSEPCHFPSLEHLTVKSCHFLEEIPIEWGESCSLNKIEYWNLNSLMVRSISKIMEVQYELGNQHFRVVRLRK